MKTEIEQAAEQAAKAIYTRHPHPDEYWYPNSAVIELQQKAFELGAEWHQSQLPAPLTEEQADRMARDEFPDPPYPKSYWLSMAEVVSCERQAYKAALLSRQQPEAGEVTDETQNI